jgi:hypothetical protein
VAARPRLTSERADGADGPVSPAAPGRGLRARWHVVPGWARCLPAAYLIGFTEGTGEHIRDLARAGLHAYRGFGPAPVQVFLLALVLLDPIVVILVARVTVAGVVAAVLVMAADLVANGYANHVLARPGAWLHSAALWAISLFALLVFVTAWPLIRALRPR